MMSYDQIPAKLFHMKDVAEAYLRSQGVEGITVTPFVRLWLYAEGAPDTYQGFLDYKRDDLDTETSRFCSPIIVWHVAHDLAEFSGKGDDVIREAVRKSLADLNDCVKRKLQ